jgi:phenylacetate-CoA ligase
MILRGVNVFPTQIEEQILAVRSLAPHFQIELTKDGRLDCMTVHVEAAAASASDAERRASAEALEKRIKEVVGLTVTVDVGAPESVARSQGKAQRIVDRRSGP